VHHAAGERVRADRFAVERCGGQRQNPEAHGFAVADVDIHQHDREPDDDLLDTHGHVHLRFGGRDLDHQRSDDHGAGSDLEARDNVGTGDGYHDVDSPT